VARRADVRSVAPVPAPAPPAAWRVDGLDGVALLECAARPPLPEATLTAAEAAVAALAAEGLGNAEIGRRRGTSPRTVANQLGSSYRKLGGASRTTLQARLPGRGGAR